MKQELQNKLYEKYPKIFRQKDLSMKETCMFWGIECGDGWYTLIDTLCSFLQFHTDNNKKPQIEAEQVKEKFGGLRFYTTSATDAQYGAISFAESMSYQICEDCGSTDDVIQVGSWIRSLCKTCRNEKY